jgi:hypothetical protein
MAEAERSGAGAPAEPTPGGQDPLFLQAKEAEASVLEPYAGESEFGNHGERVVDGQ